MPKPVDVSSCGVVEWWDEWINGGRRKRGWAVKWIMLFDCCCVVTAAAVTCVMICTQVLSSRARTSGWVSGEGCGYSTRPFCVKLSICGWVGLLVLLFLLGIIVWQLSPTTPLNNYNPCDNRIEYKSCTVCGGCSTILTNYDLINESCFQLKLNLRN